MRLLIDRMASAEGKTDDGLANALAEFSDHCAKFQGFLQTSSDPEDVLPAWPQAASLRAVWGT